MALKHVLDTHALIWYLEGNPRLGGAAKLVMDSPSSEMVLPAIALAEAIYIVDKGRTSIPTSIDLLADVVGEPRVEIWPLTLEVLQQSLTTSGIPEMHDRLIPATALHLQGLGHAVEVLTKDSDLVASGLVAVVW
jgi:PIN domain nuclease of toxin-antitoxin system